MAKRAQAFEMRVIAYDPYLTDDRAKEMDLEKVDLSKLFLSRLLDRSHATNGSNSWDGRCQCLFKNERRCTRLQLCRGGIIEENALLAP